MRILDDKDITAVSAATDGLAKGAIAELQKVIVAPALDSLASTISATVKAALTEAVTEAIPALDLALRQTLTYVPTLAGESAAKVLAELDGFTVTITLARKR
jgi:hypothetical protein